MARFYKFIIGGLVICICFLIIEILKLPDSALHVFFLDVGQGDSILIETPSGNLVLIDGGPEDRALGELALILPFFRRTIDLVILTHPDKDHLEGLIYVIDRFNVQKVLMTGVSDNSPYYAAFLSKLDKKGVEVLIAEADQDFDLGGGAFLDILYPFVSLYGTRPAESNSASIVAKLIFRDFEALLTGDADAGIENKLVEKNAAFDNALLGADVLKISHHGSKTATSESFLKAVSPKTAVIQVGKDNKYGHPVMEILKRLYQRGVGIWRTDRNGRIEIIIMY